MCAGLGGMLIVGEEGGGFLLALGIEAVGDEGVEIDVEGVAGLGGFGGPLDVAIETAFDLAIDPGVARDRGADDDGGAFGFGVFDVLFEVPAVGVDGFFAGGGVDFLSFVAAALGGDAVGVVGG